MVNRDGAGLSWHSEAATVRSLYQCEDLGSGTSPVFPELRLSRGQKFGEFSRVGEFFEREQGFFQLLDPRPGKDAGGEQAEFL